MGLIRKDNEDAYREEVRLSVGGLVQHNLVLNVNKTKEIIVDFRRNQHSLTPLLINDTAVEVVSSTKCLVKRGQKRLFFLRRMRRAQLPPILTTFYRATIESILTNCISVW